MDRIVGHVILRGQIYFTDFLDGQICIYIYSKRKMGNAIVGKGLLRTGSAC